jgi:hypothetical protein
MYMHLLLPLSNWVIGARLPKEGAVHDSHIRLIDNSGRLVGNPYLGIISGLPITRPEPIPSVKITRYHAAFSGLIPLYLCGGFNVIQDQGFCLEWPE